MHADYGAVDMHVAKLCATAVKATVSHLEGRLRRLRRRLRTSQR